MNENEKRILTVLNQSGPATRKEISRACGISWASTVKLVARLEAKGFIRCLGNSDTKTENGKTSLVYALSETRPLAIGIDVEYSRTRIAVYNLRRETFYHDTVPTEPLNDVADLIAFLNRLVKRCQTELENRDLTIEGVGVGIPSWLIPSKKPIFNPVARGLSEACGLPVVVDNNTRSFTLYLQRKYGIGGSFAVFVIRKGVGIGIAIRGELYRGEDGLAGELGHLTIDPSGPLCRCGKHGCVETFFNEDLLAQAWKDHRSSDGISINREKAKSDTDRELLEELFSKASEGSAQAKEVLSRSGMYLGRAISALSLAMDIRRIILAGHFGPDAAYLIHLIEDHLKKELHPRFRHTVSYESLDDEGFLIGASMLFLSSYCDYRVLGNREERGQPSGGDLAVSQNF